MTDEFQLVINGREVALPHSVERVVAYVGLSAQPVHRMKLAGALWPDVAEVQAARSLRTALWRLQRSRVPIVDVQEDRVALQPVVRVDAIELFDLCRELLNDRAAEGLGWVSVLIDSTELLPDWDDEWVVADRERYRMLRLQTLEFAAERLIARAEYGRAMEAALAANISDPLRESARRLVIRVHLAEGNMASALGAYEDYRSLLDREIGVEPSTAMQRLIGPLEAVPAL
ncbi:MAG TPA: BTAD domain-containing putative transcriptional regulator [Actinomycetes bacterium]|nr:BTAD domain-containing putative transcriptional regulator [Actinomycetes bacterium]